MTTANQMTTAGVEILKGSGAEKNRLPSPAPRTAVSPSVGKPDGVTHRHQQPTVKAANATQPGEHAGGRARLGSKAMAVDRRPHGGAAGFDQRYQNGIVAQAHSRGHS